ncbi:MAG: site-specific DNA-methyltransferase [Paludibacter sp.]|nr:site-specific DNA-methyltransferase [Paludibacter sp.]
MMRINKIYNENCLETMERMPDCFVDLTVTSPPYDNLRDYNGYLFDFESIAKELYRVTKQGGVVVWVVGDATINGSETGTLFKQVLYFMDCGFNLHDTMIYHKAGFRFPEKTRYNPVFEYMFVFSKGKPKTVNLIEDKLNKYSGEKVARQSGQRRKNGELKEVKLYGVRNNIWYYATGRGNSTSDDIAFKHPAIFPENLARDHIVTWSNEGDLVYDCFMGSGTTAKMAIILNRKWLGSEISKNYVDLSNKRIEPYLHMLF